MNNLKRQKKEKEIILKYSAVDRKHVVGEEYKYSIGWRKFACRISRKMTDFKIIKMSLQNNICPVCTFELYDEHLHHITYKHECTFSDDAYPKCSDCFKQNISLFDQCAQKTVVVHHSCHSSLHSKNFLKE